MGGSFVLGDLIEMQSLTEAFENSAQKATGDCFPKSLSCRTVYQVALCTCLRIMVYRQASALDTN